MKKLLIVVILSFLTSAISLKVGSMSKSQIALEQSVAPYNPTTVLQLIKDIGGAILSKDNQTSNVFGGCINLMVDSPNNYSSTLTTFWSNAGNVAQNTSQWNNSYFQNVINAVATKSVSYNSQNFQCGNIQIPSNDNTSSITTILSKGSYFGGFNKSSPAQQPFISGIISSHRDNLPSNTFENINKASRS